MVTVRVNGEAREAPEPRRNLLSYLRFEVGLTGTKYGCGEGVCGACTVLVDGQAVRSCMTTVGAVAGGSITTIEGLAQAPDAAAAGSTTSAEEAGMRAGAPALRHEPSIEDLHPVQRAFVEEQAMQCGYCIPGFIMTSVALLNRTPSPTEEQVREALSLNMCRCGTYQRIVRAVLKAGQTS